MGVVNKEKVDEEKIDEEIIKEIQDHMKKGKWDTAMGLILENVRRKHVKYWNVLKQFAEECPIPSKSGFAYYVMAKIIDDKKYFLKAAEKFEEAAKEAVSNSEKEKSENEKIEKNIKDSTRFFLCAAYCYYYADKPEKGRAILIHDLNMLSERLLYEIGYIFQNKIEKTYYLPY